MMDPQDNALTQESLLEHAVWLRRLASELVRDPGAAEDLVQDTWLAALRAKPDPARPLRPWLARVMRNGATQRLRRAAGRLAKESEAARPETVPSARELVERAEQQRYLVDAVLAMPEPYREVLLLRYYEGLTPAQIADSLNMLPATVRTHLHRGILKLRDRLDKKHGGDRKAWVLMLQPLALSIPAPVPMGLLAVGWVAATAAIIAGIGLGMGWWSAGPGDPALVAESRGGQSGSVLVEPVPGDLSRALAVDMDAISSRRVRLRNASTGEPLPAYAVHAKGEVWVSDHGGWLSLPADLDQVELVDDGRLAVRTGSNHEPKAMRGIARRIGAIPFGQDPVDLAVQVGPSFRLQLHGPVVFELSDLRASLQNGGRDGRQVAPVRLA
ncbi:MAG: sigma-70 family RNA polymerase sigma factor, partial [Planctomycetota bacterium]|nr:sigma-70 family RNA polymerase sigma factor [Planctomycetota bacterium]